MDTDTEYIEWANGFNLLIYQVKVMPQNRLAREVRVDKGYVNSILKGSKTAGKHLQEAISRALGLSHDHVRELGRLLQKGHAPEKVALIAGIYRENKAPSQFTPEEEAAVMECLAPEWREGFAALREKIEADRANVARSWAGMISRFTAPSSNVEPAALPDRSRRVPVISFVRAGDWTEAEAVEPSWAEDWIESSVGGARVFALRVKGDSMEPVFREGEIILVDPDREAVNGDYVVAALEREEATLKRWERVGGRDLLIPLNPRYQPIDVTGQDWRVIGRVLEKRQIF